MRDSMELEAKNSFPESENKIPHYIKLGSKHNKDSLFAQKGKEYMKNKRAISMHQIFSKSKKINININQNININPIKNTARNKKIVNNNIRTINMEILIKIMTIIKKI